MKFDYVSPDGTVAGLAPYAARLFGAAPAFSMNGVGTISFEDLASRAAKFAGGLASLGVRLGDRVVLHLPNSVDWVIAYHAIAQIGGVVVPANILLALKEVAWMAQDCEARAIILPADRCAAVVDAGTETLMIARGPGAHNATPFDVVAAAGPMSRAPVKPSDLWTIGYTSGTTGRPKGAMLSHRAVFQSTSNTATTHMRTDRDRVLSALPLPHVYGNIVMNAAFLAGCEVVMMDRFDAAGALRLIGELGITLFEGVPTMYHQMLAAPSFQESDLSSVTRCTVGGQTMPAAVIERVFAAFRCPVLELWGMTEVAGPAITSSPYWAADPGSIGRVFPGFEAKIVDLDDEATTLPPGKAGELWVRGGQLFSGYWRNEHASAAAIADGGWFRTGDVAQQSPDASYRIVDRRKDLIITGGYNIYPAELEAVIAQLPGVAMVGVASVPDDKKGELAIAFIVRAALSTICKDDVLAHCREHLAAYKCPRDIVFVDDLPKTSTGKVLRREIGALYPVHKAQAARTKIEREE